MTYRLTSPSHVAEMLNELQLTGIPGYAWGRVLDTAAARQRSVHPEHVIELLMEWGYPVVLDMDARRRVEPFAEVA